MFSSTRVLKVSYLLVLGSAVILLSIPSPARAQRAMMAPMAPSAMPTPAMGGFMQSYMQVNMMLIQAGMPGGMMMGGMMGMGGMSMMGFAGKGMGGFNGKNAL